METMSEFMFWLPFEKIQNLLYKDMTIGIDNFLAKLWISTLIFIVLCLVMGAISFKFIYQFISDERYYLQRMLQQMPLRTILNNAHIKPFLPNKLLVI
jgi:hypothetical protein